MPQSLTHKYFPRMEQREPNLFVEEYYSSTDIRIYIDDVEQTEISYINYTLQEQLKPSYGYASRTFDDVAVGNRIVTGAIKVPIKNPQAQSQLSDIKAFAENDPIHKSPYDTSDPFEDYNQSQEELKGAVDWIDDTLQQVQDGMSPGTKPAYLDEDDETFNYRSKLIDLGYDLNYGSPTSTLIAQIKKFQQENNKEVTGTLDPETKKAIDDAIAEKWAKYDVINLVVGTSIYIAPYDDASSSPVYSLQTVTVLSRATSGWIQIRLPNGQEGWVKTTA